MQLVTPQRTAGWISFVFQSRSLYDLQTSNEPALLASKKYDWTVWADYDIKPIVLEPEYRAKEMQQNGANLAAVWTQCILVYVDTASSP